MHKSLIIGISMLSFLGTTSAFAQNYHYSHGKPPAPHHQNYGKPYAGKPHHASKPRWSKGQHLPARYRGHTVRDYKRYRLAPPPRGYRWVKVDNDYVLIGALSGLISSIVTAR